MRFIIKLTLISIIIFLQASCTGIPKNITPIDNFDLQKYLGTWYEIARLDHSFEKDLSQVTANYSIRTDGGVKVINKGYDTKKEEWKEVEGKAYFVGSNKLAHLKVSFFGPFYGSYIIFKIDEVGYQYAYVTSYNRDFLWLLSKSPEISGAVKSDFLEISKELGFNTEAIIFVEQDTPTKKLSDAVKPPSTQLP